MPPGDGPVPAIVFLHGFGGLLTAYVTSMLESDELRGYAIIAPALDNEGAWWRPAGQAVVVRTLDQLPPRVDRDRVYLVGLSNGAIGAAAFAAEPMLSQRFRRVVTVVGGDDATPRVPLRVIAGVNDWRFPIAHLEGAVHSAAARGATVDLIRIDADHMALFTHTAEVNAAIVSWLEDSGGPDIGIP
jgi:pimeloyl-ACP methyl ester carboxylesterase